MIVSNGEPIKPTHGEPLAIYISGGITGVKKLAGYFHGS